MKIPKDKTPSGNQFGICYPDLPLVLVAIMAHSKISGIVILGVIIGACIFIGNGMHVTHF